MASQTCVLFAVELRDAVARFKQAELSLSSVEQLLTAVEGVADRLADHGNRDGGVVVALDDFSRKAVG